MAVLPFDPARRTAILVRQFRAPVFLATGRDETLEAIAGIVEGNEEPIACARREAFEEAGLRLDDARACRRAPGPCRASRPSACISISRPMAQADRAAAGGGLPEENEHITVVEMPLARACRHGRRGRLDDMKALVLVQTLRLRRPDLFA